MKIQNPRGGEFIYSAPTIDLIDICVEQGFVVSPPEDWGDGTDPDESNGWGDYS